MKTAELKRSGDCIRTAEQMGKWVLKGYNDALIPEPWFDLAEAETLWEIEDEEKKIPCQFRDGGEVDQHFIISPDGFMRRIR